MQLDTLLLFSEAQALATAVSDHVVDQKLSGDDLSRRINIFAKAEGAVAGGTSIVAKLQASDDGTTYVDLVTYPSVTLADIQAGNFIIPVQPLPSGLKRYLRLDFTATGTFTGAGRILAGLTTSFDKLT